MGANYIHTTTVTIPQLLSDTMTEATLIRERLKEPLEGKYPVHLAIYNTSALSVRLQSWEMYSKAELSGCDVTMATSIDIHQVLSDK